MRLLVDAASFLVREGRVEVAAAPLAYVRNHPAGTARPQERAARLLAELTAEDREAVPQGVRVRFSGQTVKAVAEWALGEL